MSEREMAALALSLNRHASFPSTPISPQFRKPNFSPSMSIPIQRNTCSTSISFKTLNHCSLVVHGLEKDSNPETAQDSEMNSLGVKAALSMLIFYKREIFHQSCQRAVDTFHLVVSNPWKLIRNMEL